MTTLVAPDTINSNNTNTIRLATTWSKRKRRRKQNKNKCKEQSVSHFTRGGPNGRHVMTKERLNHDSATVMALGFDLTPQSVNNMLYKIKDRMMLGRLVTSHVVAHDGPAPHEQLYYATSTLTIPMTSLVARIPNTAKVNECGLIEIASTGAARRKKHAEYYAAVDLLLQLQQCGIDVHNPPSIRQQKKEQQEAEYKEKLEQAKLLLEWCNVTRPQFDTNPSRGDLWVSNVRLQCKGKSFLVTCASPGRSKAMAEGNALVAAAKCRELEEIAGKECVDTYLALLKRSRAQHVANLHVPPLLTEATFLLSDAIGDDHEMRMKQHA